MVTMASNPENPMPIGSKYYVWAVFADEARLYYVVGIDETYPEELRLTSYFGRAKFLSTKKAAETEAAEYYEMLKNQGYAVVVGVNVSYY